jgi:hypothetical protein
MNLLAEEEYKNANKTFPSIHLSLTRRGAIK